MGVEIRLILIDDTPDQNFALSKISLRFAELEIIRTGGGRGYGEALRSGTSLLNSEFVGLFNSDDLVHPQRFSKQIKMLDFADLSIAGIQKVDTSGNRIPSFMGDLDIQKFDPLFLILGAYGANATWVARRNWWVKNVFFDSEECLDWRIGLKTFMNSKISWTPEKLYFYRKHTNQVTNQRSLSFSRMKPVYCEWEIFAKTLGLSKNSVTLFNAMAAPWLVKKYESDLDLFSWTEKLFKIAEQKDPEILQSIKRLVRRRYINYAIKSNLPLSKKVKLFYKASPEFPSLIKDFLLQFRV